MPKERKICHKFAPFLFLSYLLAGRQAPSCMLRLSLCVSLVPRPGSSTRKVVFNGRRDNAPNHLMVCLVIVEEKKSMRLKMSFCGCTNLHVKGVTVCGLFLSRFVNIKHEKNIVKRILLSFLFLACRDTDYLSSNVAIQCWEN